MSDLGPDNNKSDGSLLARPPVRSLRTTRGVGARRTSQASRDGLEGSALAAAAAAAAAAALAEEEGRGDVGSIGGEEESKVGKKEQGAKAGPPPRTISVPSSSSGASSSPSSRPSPPAPNRRASAPDASSAPSAAGRRRSSAATGGSTPRKASAAGMRPAAERRRASAKYDISVFDVVRAEVGDESDDGDDEQDEYGGSLAGSSDRRGSQLSSGANSGSLRGRRGSQLSSAAGSHYGGRRASQGSSSCGHPSQSRRASRGGSVPGHASKRQSFAHEALSSLVAVFQSSGGGADYDEDDINIGDNEDEEGGSDGHDIGDDDDDVDELVDELVMTDDEDDDHGHHGHHGHPHHPDDEEAVPAPVLLGGQASAGGMARSSTMLGTGQKKFLPGASVRRHASGVGDATGSGSGGGGGGGGGGGAGHRALGAYGKGAAEAAESAARAAAEFAADGSPRKRRSLRRGSRRADGNAGADDVDGSGKGADACMASSTGMQVDFPTETRRRGSWSEGALGSSNPRTSADKMRRRGSYTSSVDSFGSSVYYEPNLPPLDGPARATSGGGASVVFGEQEEEKAPVESVPEDEVGVVSGDDDNSKSDECSSSSSDSLSIASDDICDDPDPPTLVAKGYVPCSFVGPWDSSDNRLNMYESSIGLDSTSSAMSRQNTNKTGSDGAPGSFNPAYLDAEMAAGIEGGKLPSFVSTKFAAEHYLFIRAVLQLLAERDRVGVEANMDDPHTIKAGSLKKSSSNLPGVWKVKFVEIRRGIFSYYEDKPSTGAGESLRRRNIPLRNSLCTCRAVKLRHPSLSDVGPRTSLFGGGSKSSQGFLFELAVEGGRRRLWMASSKEERQAWIRAIHEAMIGVTQTSPRLISGNSRHPLLPWIAPPKDDCDQYLKIQAATKAATSEAAYVSAITPIWNTSLCIPVQRIREQAETVATFDSPDNSRHHESRTRLGGFWDDLSRNSLSLNGHVLLGESKYGPERMMGALTRCILEFDRVASEKDAATDRRAGNFRRAGPDRSNLAEQMTEVQAISYARDILCNRSGTGRDDDSFYSVETLVGNTDLAVLIPSSQMEPVQVEVSNVNADDDDAAGLQNENTRGGNSFERSGWVDYRTKSSKKWKRRYCVLSEGVISIYENGYPRPHGLRAQLVLVGGAISTTRGGTGPGDDIDNDDAKSGDESKHSSPERSVRKHVVFIRTRDTSKPKHYVAFQNRAEMIGWAEAIRSSIETCSPDGVVTDINMSESGSSFNEIDAVGDGKKGLLSSFRPPFLGGGGGEGTTSPPDESRGSLFGTLRKGGKLSNEVSSRPPAQDDTDSARKNTFFRNMKRAPSAGTVMAALQPDKYPDATVQISVQSSTMYKLCTSNPDGDENQDTWGMVRTKLLRNYLLAGGPNGRMIRGEDVVELEFLKGIVREETFHLIFSKKDALANIGEISASKK